MLHAGRAFVYVYDARPCRRVKITLASWQQRDIMKQIVRLVIPAAPAPAQSSNTQAAQRSINQQGIRLGVLDNSKGNADHLLKMIVEGWYAMLMPAHTPARINRRGHGMRARLSLSRCSLPGAVRAACRSCVCIRI